MSKLSEKLNESPRINENDDQNSQEFSRKNYDEYVVKPNQILELWYSENPIDFCQELLEAHLNFLSKSAGIDINAFNENEKRYELNQELKWLAQYLINGLIMIKNTLKVRDD